MNNLWNDDLTLSIASTVSDVLEGKIKVEEMNPKDHVKQNKDGGYDVFDGKGNVAKTFGKKEEAEGYAIKNHDALMAAGKEVDEVAEPEAKGEKEFKAKHKVKKSGDKEDGTNMKEEITISIDYMHKIDEKLKPGKGKETIDVDYIGDKGLTKKLESKFKVKIKQTGSSTADITGDRKNIINLLKSDAYLMDEDEIEDTFSELKESVEDKEFDEESEKQKKYQAFFNKALKKFGVSSPAELEGDKKKEFFDYIDKNYEATDESVKEDVRDMKNYKDRDRKGHEAYMSIQVVKGNTSNKFDDDFGFSKAEMVMMDKLISKIKNMHVSSFDGGSSGPASLEFYGDEASLKKFIADKNVQKIVKKYKGKVSGPNKA
jgi:hypothetical protein